MVDITGHKTTPHTQIHWRDISVCKHLWKSGITLDFSLITLGCFCPSVLPRLKSGGSHDDKRIFSCYLSFILLQWHKYMFSFRIFINSVSKYTSNMYGFNELSLFFTPIVLKADIIFHKTKSMWRSLNKHYVINMKVLTHFIENSIQSYDKSRLSAGFSTDQKWQDRFNLRLPFEVKCCGRSHIWTWAKQL